MIFGKASTPFQKSYVKLSPALLSLLINKENFQHLMISFIDRKFCAQTFCLSMTAFNEKKLSHCGLEICDVIENTLIKYGLQQTAVVTDNAANMRKAAEDAVLPWLACQPHTLQLAIISLRQKCTAIVGFLNRSDVAAVKFSKLQEEAQKKQLNIPGFIEERWNSSYEMWQRCV